MSKGKSKKSEANRIREQEAAVKELEDQVLKILEIAQTIQKFTGLTTTLEQLVFSLDADNNLVERAIELVSSFDEKYESLSAEKLEIRIEGIENKIQDDIRFFIELFKAKTTPREKQSRQVLPDNHIEEFNRRIQKAFAFRVLLCERGENLPPFELEVPISDIQASINNLKIRTRVHKHRLSTELIECRKKIEDYLTDSTATGKTREAIVNLLQGIVANIEHMEKGGELSEIPIKIENMILEIRRIGTNQSKEKQEKSEEPKREKTADKKRSRKPTKDETQESDYFVRVKKWLDSPLGVSWKQINKEHGKK